MKEKISVCVSIGNTDNKLTQGEWSRFVYDVRRAIREITNELHADLFSLGDKPWQNAAWIFDITAENALSLQEALKDIAERYGQDSIYWLSGAPKFIAWREGSNG